MDNINLSSYYDKISQIKARVMNKQRDYTREITSKYTNENTNHVRTTSNYSNYNSQLSQYGRERDGYENRQPLDSRRDRDGFEKRQPLDSRKDRDNNIMNRVKELGFSKEKPI